ncbi:MAG: serine hydrolase [Citricoccus sp.]
MDDFEPPVSRTVQERPERQELERRLAALADSVPFALHYAVEQTAPTAAPGEAGGITRGADVVLPSFSTRKVSILCAALALARAGRLDPQRLLTVTAEHREGVQAGILRHLAPGLELTLDDCLVQMMCTSDNICTQLVFEAIGTAVEDLPQDALQFVNDYCAWAGMRSTLHREVFPRTGGLAWHHSLDGLTVTTAVDQARLLVMLGRGAGGTGALEAAARLQLTPADCRRAIELMRGLHTPRLGAATTRIGFAEKNGRGLRSLSQVGLALGAGGEPLAAVAVYAEAIPTAMPDGVPGRNAVFAAFAEFGRAVEDWAAPVVTA